MKYSFRYGRKIVLENRTFIFHDSAGRPRLFPRNVRGPGGVGLSRTPYTLPSGALSHFERHPLRSSGAVYVRCTVEGRIVNS